MVTVEVSAANDALAKTAIGAPVDVIDAVCTVCTVVVPIIEIPAAVYELTGITTALFAMVEVVTCEPPRCAVCIAESAIFDEAAWPPMSTPKVAPTVALFAGRPRPTT